MRLPLRLYRLLLTLYPARFREDYTVPMLRQFEEDYAETRGARDRIRFCAGTLLDVARTAPGLVLQEITRDSRHTFRLWRSRPVHTLFAGLVLALAIGASTGLFGVLNALLLRSLPFHNPERLASFERYGPPHGEEFHQWRAQSAFLADAAMYDTLDVNLAGPVDGRRARLTGTSWNFFGVFGRQPVLGRAFLPGEDRPGQNSVAVISHRLWHQLHGGDTRALGADVRVNGAALTIVGVAPPGFDYPERTDLWAPTTFDWKAVPRTSPAILFRTVGRLRSDLSWDEARRALVAETLQRRPELADSDPAERPALVPLREQLAGPVRRASIILLAAVALLLALACANIANLLLARTVARAGELRIRAALGASRARLVQQLLTEAVLLSTAAGATGLLVAWWTTRVATAVQPSTLDAQAYTIFDWRVLVFAIALALAAGLVFGLGPALYALRADLSHPGHMQIGAARLSRARGALVAAQIALTLVLLTGAFSLGRAFQTLTGTDHGFELRSVATMTVSLPGSGYEDGRASTYYSEVLRRVREVPGVRSASTTESLPLHQEGGVVFGFRVDGHGDAAPARMLSVAPGYLATIGTPVLFGREFTDDDLSGSGPVVLVNDVFARRVGDPSALVGRSLSMNGVPIAPRRIVGVIGGMRDGGPAHEPGPQVLTLSRSPRAAHVVVRVSGSAASRIAAIRDAVRSVDPKVPVFDVRTLEERLETVLTRPRFYASSVVFFGVIALLLAVVGVYAVVSYTVAQRTREMGVRLALGTTPARLRAGLLRQGIRPVAAGTAAGVALAFAASRFLQALVTGAGTAPIPAMAFGIVITTAVSAAAIWSATRHVARLDITEVLRANTE